MHSFFVFLRDTLFPICCISCQKNGVALCSDCLSLISINTTPAYFSKSGALKGIFYAAGYQEQRVQRAIALFKYRPFIKELALPLASLIISHFALINNKTHPFHANGAENSETPFILCPIPLHKKRLRWRGFNQAELLANALSKTSGVPTYSALERIKNNAPQVELNGEQRKQNVKGIFRVKQDYTDMLHGKTVFLVDDVATTGATMKEAARVLKDAGAKSVWGIAVARG